MRVETLIVILLTIVTGCHRAPEKIITEGKIVYVTSGGGLTAGDTIDFLFNERYIVIKFRMKNNRTQITKFDKRTSEALMLVQDWFAGERDQYFYYDLEDKDQPAGLFAFGADVSTNTTFFGSRTLIGFNCKHTVQSTRSGFSREVWYTDQIRPGVWPPATQLTGDRLVLSYHQEILGHHYWINAISFSDQEIPDNEFEHAVPDPFYFKVPFGYLATDKASRGQFTEIPIPSLTYPYYNGDRMSTIEYFQKQFDEFIPDHSNISMAVDFVVDKDGVVSNIVARCEGDIDDDLKRSFEDQAKQRLNEAGGWSPATVRGMSVNSKVPFVYSKE